MRHFIFSFQQGMIPEQPAWFKKGGQQYGESQNLILYMHSIGSTNLVLTTLKSIKRVLEVSLWEKKIILNTKCISHCVFFLAVCQLNKPINMHCQPQACIQHAISSSWDCCPIFVIDTYFNLGSNNFFFLGRMPTMLIFAKYMSNCFFHSFLLLGGISCIQLYM